MSENELIERVVNVIIDYDLFAFCALPDRVKKEIALTCETEDIETIIDNAVKSKRQEI